MRSSRLPWRSGSSTQRLFWIAAFLGGGVLRCGAEPASGEGCPKDPSFYEGKYILAEDAEFGGGFAFLRSIRGLGQPLLTDGMRKGAKFDLEGVRQFTKRLQDRLSAVAETRIHVGIVTVYLERCSPPDGTSGELHLSVNVYDSNPSLALFRQFESRTVESEDAATAAQTAKRRSNVRIQPRTGFNESDKFLAGGTLSAGFSAGPIRSLLLDGTGSAKGGRADVEFAGDRSWESGLIEFAVWRFGFQYSDRPAADDINLAGSALYGSLRLTTHPLGDAGTVLRFASEVAGGNSQTSLYQGTLPSGTLASSSNRTWKSAAGLTTRIGTHSMTASYGLHLGGTRAERLLDYHKHFGDVAYSTYKLVGDHKILEYETRVTAGTLQIRGAVPVGERFFGGNRETALFAGPEVSADWRIRTNPFLRGISANRFNRLSAGEPIIGGEGFVAWNNTIGLPLPFLNYPLLPSRVTEADDFKRALKTQLSANESALTVSYTAEDAEYKKAVEELPDVEAALKAALKITADIEKSGGAGQGEAAKCSKLIKGKLPVLEEAAEALQVVVDEQDSDAIIPVVRACVERVRAAQPDPHLDEVVADLQNVSKVMRDLLANIDEAEVKKKVARDMALVNRVSNVFFKEASIVSIRPIVIFDIARMTGPTTATEPPGVRYSVGGGLRLQFLRALNLSFGYAANPHRLPSEGPGTFFFSMDVLDVFR
jgi:hypothetical protein